MMVSFEEIKRSFLVSLWFVFLTFPIMVIRVNTIEKTVEWRWERALMVGIGSFVLSFVWRFLIKWKEAGRKNTEAGTIAYRLSIGRKWREYKLHIPAYIGIAGCVIAFPFVFSLYQTNIMVTALIYVVIGLGLNIVVGLAGLLDLAQSLVDGRRAVR